MPTKMLKTKKQEKMKNKKAYFYSLDALIAVMAIFAVLLVINPISKQKTQEMNLQYDTIEALSSLKMSEIDNSYARQLVSEGKASSNNTVLEQIAEFYAKGMPEAKQLTENLISQLGLKENIGIWFGNELIANLNSTAYEKAEQVWTARQIVSGLEKPEEGDVKGYSARVFLTRASQVEYFYFGGYVGDGNISIKVNYNGTLNSANMEIAINKNFALYVNGNFEGNFEKTTSAYTPQSYTIPTQHFHSGENLVELKGDNLFIAGGYIKINYQDSSFAQQKKKFFPGISGVINIYDSFYVPSSLNSMEIFLHYSSPYQLFLTIGNKTIYEGNGSNSITLTNSQLSSLLNYQELGQKTTPLRLGLYEVQRIIKQGNADVVLITDLSDSMSWRMDSEINGVTRNCNDANLYDSDTKRVSLAKCLDKMVVDMILNVSGNRLALSAFYGDASSPFKGRVYEEGLTNNSAYLKQKIDVYTPQGGTCICCSINDAYKILSEQSNASRHRFVIVMSDGIPTHTCQAASGCEGTRTGLPADEGLWLGYGAGCYGGLDDCEVNDCSCASQNANWSSCRLKNNLNAKVYSIGFGPVASCNMANKTLQNIATCGQGKYYSSQNPLTLEGIYSGIASEILQIGFIEQLSNITGVFNLTTLYPDSYISLDYSIASTYGLAITSETLAFGNEISEGTFLVPSDSTPLEAIAVSYSSAKWTDKVYISNSTSQEKIFDLSIYSQNYLNLGDPYFIYIPKEKISKGENKVKITTGISPTNSSGGSSSNKIIYTILKAISGYSPIKPSIAGCVWNIEFFDSTNTTIKVPANYNGTRNCYFTSTSRIYNENDALDYAIYDLLSDLDFNLDYKVDSKFSQQDLTISSNEISGIPFTHYTEVQVRVWR